jgi:hypothetical protein
MIRTARLCRCSVLLPRVPARHGDPLSLHQTNTPNPAPDDAVDRAEREASDRDTAVVLLRPCLMTAIIGPDKERPG